MGSLTALGVLVTVIKTPSNFNIAKNFLYKLRKKIPNYKELKVGINFDYSGFIAGGQSGTDQTLISGIQLLGSGSIDKIMDAYIRSNITKSQIPLLVSTKKQGYLNVNAAKKFEIDDLVRMLARFYDVSSNLPQGKYYNDFIQEWGDFSVIMVRDGKEIEMKRFKATDINKHLNTVFPHAQLHAARPLRR